MCKDEYKPGELFIYTNGDRWELGQVKRKVNDSTYACYYSTGDTAARTPVDHMHKLANAGWSRIEGSINEIVHDLVTRYDTDVDYWPRTG